MRLDDDEEEVGNDFELFDFSLSTNFEVFKVLSLVSVLFTFIIDFVDSLSCRVSLRLLSPFGKSRLSRYICNERRASPPRVFNSLVANIK